MKKNVYSLILADNIVKEIDRMAYANRTNRSNMINQILAEYCSCTTPEMRIRDIFGQIESLMDNERFQAITAPSDSIFTLRSALDYKYNPSIRYTIELYRNCENNIIGSMRVTFRTQNLQLIDELTSFFLLWDKIESDTVTNSQRRNTLIESGKYERKFLAPEMREDCAAQEVADAIAAYLKYFDTALKSYFRDKAAGEEPDRHIREIYNQYKQTRTPII